MAFNPYLAFPPSVTPNPSFKRTASPPLNSNVRPRQCTRFATSLQASCFDAHRAPASERTARFRRSPARASRPPPRVSFCARAFGFALLEPCAGGRARVLGGVVTHAPLPCSTAAPLKAAGALPWRQRPGARQGSCRLIHAASGCLSSAVECAATTESRSGLSVTAPRGDQSRVGPDHRAGWRSRAVRYSACRAARMG